MRVNFNTYKSKTFCGNRTIITTIKKEAETSLNSDNRKLNLFIKQLKNIGQNDSVKFSSYHFNESGYTIKWSNSDTSESEAIFCRPTDDSLHCRLGGRVLGQIDLVETKGNKVARTTVDILIETMPKIKALIDAIAERAGNPQYKDSLQKGINNVLNLHLAPLKKQDSLPF